VLVMLIIGLTPLKGYVGLGVNKNEVAAVADERIVNALAPVKTTQNSYASSISTLQSDVNALESTMVSSGDLQGYVSSGTLTAYVSKSQLTTELAGYATKAELAEADIGELQEEIDTLLAEVQEDVNAAVATAVIDIQEIATGVSAGIEYSIRGSVLDYWVKLKDTGPNKYRARVVLVYNTPVTVGNTTSDYGEALADFYSKLVTPPAGYPVRVYTPTLVRSAGLWKVSQITFYTGALQLTATELEKEWWMPVAGLGTQFLAYDIYVELVKGGDTTTPPAGGGTIPPYV